MIVWILILLLVIWVAALMYAAYYKGRADEIQRK
jgi:Tfp pilus assembly protein PilO